MPRLKYETTAILHRFYFLRVSYECNNKKNYYCITVKPQKFEFVFFEMLAHSKQEISLKKIFGGSQILTILTQLSDEIPLYSLSLHAGKGCSV